MPFNNLYCLIYMSIRMKVFLAIYNHKINLVILYSML